MSIRCAKSCMALAIFAIVRLPPRAHADQSGTATLAPNTFLNLDTGGRLQHRRRCPHWNGT